jgi:hypothetical protein
MVIIISAFVSLATMQRRRRRRRQKKKTRRRLNELPYYSLAGIAITRAIVRVDISTTKNKDFKIHV